MHHQEHMNGSLTRGELWALSKRRGAGVCSLASQAEAAGLESLLVVQNTHVPVSGVVLLG